jgi:hypothetical protein
MNFRALCQIGKKGHVIGLPCVGYSQQVCEMCLIGKLRRPTFPRESIFRQVESVRTLHGDLCETNTTPTSTFYL